MIRDITLGQFYPANSAIHRLDPRTKLIASFLFIVDLFLVDSLWGFAFCTFMLAWCVAISKVPVSFIFRGMKPVLFILIFTVALNLFMVNGRVLFQWGILRITAEGIYTALFMGIRLVLLVVGSTVLTLTTKPIELTDGLEKLMKPLTALHLPSHEIAMMMSIALRFIPVLLEETDKIMKAQQARGADFESGNLIRRAKALIPVLVPLFVSALRIAQDLAMAMEARCYSGGKGRTRLHEIRFKRGDALFFTLSALTMGGVILLRIFL